MGRSALPRTLILPYMNCSGPIPAVGLDPLAIRCCRGAVEHHSSTFSVRLFPVVLNNRAGVEQTTVSHVVRLASLVQANGGDPLASVSCLRAMLEQLLPAGDPSMGVPGSALAAKIISAINEQSVHTWTSLHADPCTPAQITSHLYHRPASGTFAPWQYATLATACCLANQRARS